MIAHPALGAGLLLLVFGLALAVRHAVRRMGPANDVRSAIANEQRMHDWIERNM